METLYKWLWSFNRVSTLKKNDGTVYFLRYKVNKPFEEWDKRVKTIYSDMLDQKIEKRHKE